MSIVKAKSLYLSIPVSIIQSVSRGVVPIGRTAVSKPMVGGSNPSTPAKFCQTRYFLVVILLIATSIKANLSKVNSC